MTSVAVSRDEHGICGLSASGHAGYADSGSDIVCAAVSVLMTTCANALESVAGVAPVIAQSQRGALLSVTLPPKLTQAQGHDAQIILQTTLQGLTDVAAQYPKHLHIIDGRNQSC